MGSGTFGMETRQKPASSFRRAWSYARPYRWTIAAGFVCMAIVALAGLVPPLIIGRVVDDLGAGRFDRTGTYVLMLIGLFVAEGLFSGVRNRLMHVAGEWFVLRIRSDAYRSVQRLSLSYFEQNTTGDIMSRLSGDVDAIEDMLVHGTDDILVNAIRFVGITGMLIYLDWRIALAVALPAPFIALGLFTFAKRIRKTYRLVRDQLGDLNAKLQDNITGIRVIKGFAAEGRESELFEGKSLDYANRRISLIRLWTVFYPAMEFLGGLGFVAVIWVGARLIQSGEFSAGDLVATFAYVMQFYGPIHTFSRINETIQRALAAADRVFELMDAQPDVSDREGAHELDRVRGKVEFRNVGFRYASGGEVLRDVSFVAESGECVALVGRSGAGKTSVINLVPRFYDPIVDDIDVRDVVSASLRRNVAMVLQDTFLFNGTVRENIAYARPGATDAEIAAAARIANAHEFIEGLESGYDTEIGERGVKLSGGQKQRMSIARAVLADPRILILDEATSSVDTESELLIHEALEKLIQGRTTFIIAHRLSTVQKADKIIVLEEGRIVEEGNHQALLAKGGAYARMCDMQFALAEVERDYAAAST